MKQIFVVLFSIAFAPLPAFAMLFEVKYAGRVTNIYSNPGYNIGDTISGNLYFDLDGIEDMDTESQDFSHYQSPEGKDFVKGFLPAGFGRNVDTVSIADLFGSSEANRDEMIILDFAIDDEAKVFYLLHLQVSLEKNWINGTTAKEFELTKTDLQSPRFFDAWGTMQLLQEHMQPDGSILMSNIQTVFKLDYLSVNAVQVPEPAPIALFFVGFCIVLFRNRVHLSHL